MQRQPGGTLKAQRLTRLRRGRLDASANADGTLDLQMDVIQTHGSTCGDLYLLSLFYVRRVGIQDKAPCLRPAVTRAGTGTAFIIGAVIFRGHVVHSRLHFRDPVFAAIVRRGRRVALVVLILYGDAYLVFRANDRMMNGITVLVQYAPG